MFKGDAREICRGQIFSSLETSATEHCTEVPEELSKR